jgi:hypothetical protein
MEQERPIEKKLREYGKGRCERMGDLRLHPATRRMLHGEVARTWGTSRSNKTRFLGFWPKVAWSSGVLAVVLFVAIISSRGPEERYQLAGKPKSADSDRAVGLITLDSAQPAPQGNVALSTTVTSAENERPSGVAQHAEAKAKGVTAGEMGVPLASPASPAERQVAPTVVGTLSAPAASAPVLATRGGLVAAPTTAIRGQVATVTEPAQMLADRVEDVAKKERAGSVSSDGLAAGLAVTNGVPQVVHAGRSQFGFNRQVVSSSPAVLYERTDSNAGPVLRDIKDAASEARLARRFSADKTEQPRSESFMANQSYVRTPTPQAMGAWNTMNNEARLLSNFRMQQTDAGLEIVDGDGSVYTGQMELVTTNSTPAWGYYAGAKLNPTENAVSEEPTLRFQVTGTNKSLNQAIVFSGQIMPQTAVLNNQSALNQFNNTNVQLGLAGVSNQMFNNSQQLNNSQLLNNQFQLMPMLQNSRISGKVRVGSEETEIDATPRNP